MAAFAGASVSAQYEDEIRDLLTYVEARLASGDAALHGKLTEAKDVLKRLKLEGRMMQGGAEKQAVLAACKAHQASIDRLSRQLLLRGGGAGGAGGAGAGAGASSGSQRQRVTNQTDRLAGGNDALAQANRTVAETEQLAQGILEELGAQRATIGSAHDKVRDTNANMDEAGSILKRMQHWTRKWGFR